MHSPLRLGAMATLGDHRTMSSLPVTCRHTAIAKAFELRPHARTGRNEGGERDHVRSHRGRPARPFGARDDGNANVMAMFRDLRGCGTRIPRTPGGRTWRK